MRFSRVPVTAMALMGIGLAVPGHSVVGQDPTEKRVFVLPHVLEVLDQTIAQPAPAGLSPAEAKNYAAETEWLKSARTRIEQLGTQVGIIAPRDAASGMPTGKRQVRTVTVVSQLEYPCCWR